MTLGEMISQLKACPHSRNLRIGLGKPHSYRGYYDWLAFELVLDTTVIEMLRVAEDTNGRTFSGWKGGEFVMSASTPIYVAWRGDCGVDLTPELLGLLLSDPR
jgi:hypothetical protein